MEEGIKKIEPIIIGFQREAHSLQNLCLTLSYEERHDFIRRMHMAEETMRLF